MRQWATGLIIALALTGCGGEAWQTKAIDGLLPPLQLELSTAGAAPLTEADLRGQAVLLLFGFTSCPDICPTSLARLAAVRDGLPEPLAERVRIVFVSVDPARDTPQRLQAYAEYFGTGILGVTGSPEQLRTLARRYRTTFSHGEPDAHGQYPVSHSAGVYVFDPQGRARLLFRLSDSTEAMRADLQRLLD